MVSGEITPGRSGVIRASAGDARQATQGLIGHAGWRTAGAFVVVAGGLLLAAAAFGDAMWAWIVWLAVGVVAGSVAGRLRLVWTAWLGIVVFYAVAWQAGLASLVYFWWLAALAKTLAVSAMFAAGTAIGWRRDRIELAGASWAGLSRTWRRISIGTLIVALVALVGFTGYVGYIGSAEIVSTTTPSTSCATPASQFGWAYEAINYDLADDAALAKTMDSSGSCPSQGARAGAAVRSADGVSIAGWYVPAAAAIGPTGPTVVIVHGGKANKSDVLKYAPPFHAAYNLVFVDLRGSGRSGPALATWGLREKDDVRAMIDWLVATKHPGWIALMGNSNGAATAVAEAVGDQRVQALVLDSMQADIATQMANVLEDERDLPGIPGSWAMVVGASLRVGADVTSVDPVRTITQVGKRPVLLIQGSADKVDPPAEAAERNLAAARKAGVPVGLEICPGAGHGTVIDTCPAQWAQWATSFLAGARGG